MGDPYKKQQVKNTQKRRESALVDAAQPRLCFGEIFANATLTLMPDPGTDFSLGEALAILAGHDGMKVVRNGYEQVGRVENETAVLLRDFFAKDGGSNVVQVRVADVAQASGVAHADMI